MNDLRYLVPAIVTIQVCKIHVKEENKEAYDLLLHSIDLYWNSSSYSAAYLNALKALKLSVGILHEDYIECLDLI